MKSIRVVFDGTRSAVMVTAQVAAVVWSSNIVSILTARWSWVIARVEVFAALGKTTAALRSEQRLVRICLVEVIEVRPMLVRKSLDIKRLRGES